MLNFNHSKILLTLISLNIAPLLSSTHGNSLQNGGFEFGLDLWLVNETMSVASPDAAKDGKLGLRVTDQDSSEGSSVYSRSFPIEAGMTATLTFDARADKKFLAVYLWPMDANGKIIRDENFHGDGLAKAVLQASAPQWQSYSVEQVMPTGTEAVKIWIHSWSAATGVADIDNVTLTGLGESVTANETASEGEAANAKASHSEHFAERPPGPSDPTSDPAKIGRPSPCERPSTRLMEACYRLSTIPRHPLWNWYYM